MTSDNSKQITRIKSVSLNGGPCPDGADCPTSWRTTEGTYIIQGVPVTDPEVLAVLKLPVGEIAVEIPAALWDEP
jgi:hypothetical protein